MIAAGTYATAIRDWRTVRLQCHGRSLVITLADTLQQCAVTSPPRVQHPQVDCPAGCAQPRIKWPSPDFRSIITIAQAADTLDHRSRLHLDGEHFEVHTYQTLFGTRSLKLTAFRTANCKSEQSMAISLSAYIAKACPNVA